MKLSTIALLALLLSLALTIDAAAQQNAETALYLPPYTMEYDETQAQGDAIDCSLSFTGSIFGVSEIKGTTNPVEFIIGTQTAPYAMYRIDENCNLISSWSTVSIAASNLGVAFDTQTNNTYWMIQHQPSPRQVIEYQMGTGVATGRSFVLGTAGLPGPLCTNDNSGVPYDMYYEDIANDTIYQFNPVQMTFGCTFLNPDQMGQGAFGNGLDDAVDPSACGTNAELVATSGTGAEGMVTRAGQFDCNGGCPDTWNFVDTLTPAGVTFIQSFAEYTSSAGQKRAMVADGIINTVFVTQQKKGLSNCQGVDNEILFKINLQAGGTDFIVQLPATNFLQVNASAPSGGGNGKFVHWWNAGLPDETTINSLPAQLGPICFPMLDVRPATEMAIFNNIGRTNRLGASHYFGATIADPPKAPSIMWSNPSGDTTNMPAGSCWTMQGIMINPAASSSRPASVSNAVGLILQ